MEMNDLNYFMAVAKHENINKAGRVLRISPSALSKSVSKLEGELGVKLFQRVGRSIVLSDSGRLLQKEGRRILNLEEDIRIKLFSHSVSWRL